MKRTPPHRAAVAAIHLRLREAILRRKLHPGDVLSQVTLANEYGVSRTPMREALRMLQEEGLVTQEPNRRARVADFRLDDLEAIAAQRILLSAFATYLTVPHLDAAALAELSEAFERMRKAGTNGDAERWRSADVAFHEAHQSRAPVLLRQDIRRLQERSGLYRSIWLRDEPHHDAQSQLEHDLIAEACRRRDAVEAMRGVARHQARIAIAAMTRAIPEREPVTIRTALQLALGDGLTPPSGVRRSPSRSTRLPT